jgi:hypothetical protein
MDFKKINNIVESINQSKYMAGIAMILLNIGSKYILMDISETQEEFMNNTIFRRFVIFTICFIATRDLIVSLTLTAAFVILVGNLFNENSKYCMIKPKKKPFKQITKNDYQKALKIQELYELQQKNNSKS